MIEDAVVESPHYSINLINPFRVSMNHLLIHHVGFYLMKTNIGYYKTQYMYLLNQELYLYEN